MEALRINPRSDFRPERFTEGFIDGYGDRKLHTAKWMPEEAPRAIILLLHGLGDHIMRFHSWSNYFTDYGIGVIGMDLGGHGKSDGKRGAVQYNNLMKDVKKLLDHAHKLFPDVPRILYGHCIGGNLALNYTIRNKPAIAGVISTSPWLRSAYTYTRFSTFLSKIILKLYPSFTVEWQPKSTCLTHDTNEIREYEHDSLVHPLVSLKLLESLEDEGAFILKSKHKINTPLLLMHGSSDKITSWRATAQFAKYTSQNTTYKLWQDDYHELHHENEKVEIFEFIINWINNLPEQKK